jgi:hypothetical protein
MQKQDVAQSLIRRLSQRLTWKVRLGLLGIALLLAGAMAPAAVNYLVPKAPNRVQGVTARLGWYVQDGRLKADLHTLANQVEYLLASEHETPSVPNPVNPPVAENAVASPPNS